MAEVKAPTNKFKGDGPILILGLLKDDEQDREMGRMTDLLEKRVKGSGRKAERIDASESLNGKLGGARTLYITGHSRFMEKDTKIRPVPERTLGGFSLDSVAEVLFQGICSGITEIEFWCCESACKRGTGTLPGNAGGEFAQRFDVRAFKTVKERSEAKAWSEISTLDVVCDKLMKLAAKGKRPFETFPTVRITGLNGVGYITEGDPYITTFDQGLMLPEYNNILGFEKQIRDQRGNQHTKKNLEQADERLRKHIAGRSCHFITQELDFGAFKAEWQAAAKAEKKAKTEANFEKLFHAGSERNENPQPLARARVQELDAALKPLVEKKMAERVDEPTEPT